MPIKIPEALPGRKILEAEGVPVITADRAARQDIRPLHIAILNLMPNKIETETQLLRVIGTTPLQVEVDLLHTASHHSKNTASEHLIDFYQTIDDVAGKCYDGLIVTGAPLGKVPFEDVDYWPELQRVFNWATTNVYSTMTICWGALAALHHYHGLEKRVLPEKHSGVFPHRITTSGTLLTLGFDDSFGVPVSRHTEIRRGDIAQVPALRILAESPQTGVCLVEEPEARRVYMFNHLEYDADTLKKEFMRDTQAGLNPAIPYGYFPCDNPENPPPNTWRSHRNLLFHNWINTVYQGTPYNLQEIPQHTRIPAPRVKVPSLG